MSVKYVAKNTAKFVKTYTNGKIVKAELLWGDQLEVDESIINPDGYIKCKARGTDGFIEPNSYGDKALLEIYVIDVGQGDGILIKCPNEANNKRGRHIMIDGGYLREKQPTFKNAADFVDWKFAKEYGADKIAIDDMIVSHCDADHYGGLWDLISSKPEAKDELDLKEVKVTNFYHAGIAWVTKTKGARRSLGVESGGKMKTIFTDRQSFVNALGNTYPKLQGEYGQFIKEVVNSSAIQNINILGYDNTVGGHQYMPGYAPYESEVAIKVLGPIQERTANGNIELFDMGSHSKNTNGNSVVLSLQYKQFKMLLTGDLNKPSQDVLGQYHGKKEFASDVAKACHHGSQDVSYKFLEHINAAATVISSGDNEKHSHPRPNLMAMAAITGFITTEDDSLRTPLIYATEIARSMRIGTPLKANINHPKDNNLANNLQIDDPSEVWVNYKQTNAGDLNAANKNRTLDRLTLVDGVIYGLINIRTDGDKILLGVMNEKANTWDVETFNSRF